MDNQITCPNCKKIINNEPLIDIAVRQSGSGSQSITCDCGERITYWAITAQLRKQKTLGWKFRTWLRTIVS